MDALGIVVLTVVGAVLALSGLAKIRSGDVITATARYKLVPEPYLPAFALLPWLECALGASLLLGFHARLALVLTATLMAGFAGAIAVNVRRGRLIDCGCRAKRRPIGWRLVVENLVLSLGCVAAATLTAVPAPLPSVLGQSAALSSMEAITLVVLTAQAVTLYQVGVVVPAANRTSRRFPRFPTSMTVSQ